jgi:hypothetical protein
LSSSEDEEFESSVADDPEELLEEEEEEDTEVREGGETCFLGLFLSDLRTGVGLRA